MSQSSMYSRSTGRKLDLAVNGGQAGRRHAAVTPAEVDAGAVFEENAHCFPRDPGAWVWFFLVLQYAVEGAVDGGLLRLKTFGSAPCSISVFHDPGVSLEGGPS